MGANRAVATSITGLAGGLAWVSGMLLFFGPAQAILADPDLQSEKFYRVMADPVHPPRMAEAFWILPAGLMVLGFIYAIIFTIIEQGLPGRTATGRGLSFGLIAWALAFTWFEFYLPWNIMREPLGLVLIELICWLGTMLVVGLAISWSWSLTGGSRLNRS